MSFRSKQVVCGALIALGFIVSTGRVRGQATPMQRVVAADASLTPGLTNEGARQYLRAWDAGLAELVRQGVFRTVRRESDAQVLGRQHERLAQFYRGVRVFGADMTRQTGMFGQVVTIVGTYFPDIAADVTAGIPAADAAKALTAAGGGILQPSTTPELMILPMNDGTYPLVWRGRVLTSNGRRQIFIDATTGAEVFSYNDAWSQGPLKGAVGGGFGVIGDRLKVQSQLMAG